jgi:hypothetical protein
MPWCCMKSARGTVKATRGVHRRELVVGRLAFEGLLAHGEGAQRRMPDVGGVVDSILQPVERCEIFRKRFPPPRYYRN